MIRHALVGLCLCALSGCALLRPAPMPQSPPLLPPPAYGKPRLLRQQVSLRFHGKTREYTTVMQLQPHLLRLIWFGTLGARLFSIQWDGTSLCIKAPGGRLPGALSPAWLLADVQSTFAPLPALKRALAQTGWRVRRPRPGERLLAWHGQDRVRVIYARPGSVLGTVTVKHPGMGLQITIDSKPLGSGQKQGGSQ